MQHHRNRDACFAQGAGNLIGQTCFAKIAVSTAANFTAHVFIGPFAAL
jgi:hypothetical protein